MRREQERGRIRPGRRRAPWLSLLLLLLTTGAMPAQAIDARVRAALEPKTDAWVGQQVILNIELLSNGLSFSDQRIRLPDIPGALVLEDAVSTLKLSEQVDGETWQVLSYRYPLFAQREGRIELPPVDVAFAASDGYGSEPVGFALQTQPLAFEARIPPGVSNPTALVTTTDFALEVTVTPDPAGLKVGDALTRRVRRTAAAVSGMAFAPLPQPQIPGVAAYAKTPEVDDRSNRGELTGARTESVTYVFQQAGRVTVPGIRIEWWDPDAERLETEEIPALTLEVAANPGLAPGFEPLEEARRLAAERPWVWLAGALALALLSWSAARWLPTGIRSLQSRRRARGRSERARFKSLSQACRSHDALRAYNAYVAWVCGEGAPDPAWLRAEALVTELERLQTALVRHESDWRADAFLQAAQRARRSARQSRRRASGRALPALNP